MEYVVTFVDSTPMTQGSPATIYMLMIPVQFVGSGFFRLSYSECKLLWRCRMVIIAL